MGVAGRAAGWLGAAAPSATGYPWSEDWVTVVTSLAPTQAVPQAILRWMRQHWMIENRGHYVPDGSYGEERHHGRQCG